MQAQYFVFAEHTMDTFMVILRSLYGMGDESYEQSVLAPKSTFIIVEKRKEKGKRDNNSTPNNEKQTKAT